MLPASTSPQAGRLTEVKLEVKLEAPAAASGGATPGVVTPTVPAPAAAPVAAPAAAAARGVGSGGDSNHSFIAYAQGRLKVFNAAKNFGFISPVLKPWGIDGQPPAVDFSDGLWFFGNHNLTDDAQAGALLLLDVWTNSEGKLQARNVRVAETGGKAGSADGGAAAKQPPASKQQQQLHGKCGPQVIYPAAYFSNVPAEYTGDKLQELHKQLGLASDTVMGVKLLPVGPDAAATATQSAVVRYSSEAAADAAVEKLSGHKVSETEGKEQCLQVSREPSAGTATSKASDKDDGAKEDQAQPKKLRGVVARISMAGYGVIVCEERREAMLRCYELPAHLRQLKTSDPQKFEQQLQLFEDYKRLKKLEGQEVEADVVRVRNGQMRASNAQIVQPPPAPVPAPVEAAAAAPEAPPEAGCAVCVYPLPPDWGDARLREHFERYGTLVHCAVERRVVGGLSGGRSDTAKVQPPTDGSVVWSIGALHFEDPLRAEMVVQLGTGANLGADDKGAEGRPATLEPGAPRRTLGWREGVVMRYLSEEGLGLMRSAQVEGDIHFEAPAEARASGLNMQGLRVDAKVMYGCDGRPQAKEVRIKPDEAGKMKDAAGGKHGGDAEPGFSKRKKHKSHHPLFGPGMPHMPFMGMPMGVWPPGGMPPPYAPFMARAMMGNPFMGLMGQAPKKDKKDKKEKKAKKEDKEGKAPKEGRDAQGKRKHGAASRSRSAGAGGAGPDGGAGGSQSEAIPKPAHRPRRRHRQHGDAAAPPKADA